MTDLEALRATAHPLRLRLLSLLTGAALSATEAAHELGTTQANVSYHLRLLERAGLVRVVEVLNVKGGSAKRYRHESSSQPFRVEQSDRGEPSAAEHESRETFIEAMTVELRRRIRDRTGGPGLFTDAEIWVDDDSWKQVVKLVGEASALLHRAAQPVRTTGTHRVVMTAALFEMTPSSTTSQCR